ncbi:hypothetical protein PFLUV_G00160450 [Perca fluviatilis]|uniref:Uncharacterized protein n=1 Tax=Perca fluviatilis TaxID=8168 RepID=A0A6A5ETN2_PERFL|nr:hypothetical protein PFLUV_G00160450 [Perca fluviatilis]
MITPLTGAITHTHTHLHIFHCLCPQIDVISCMLIKELKTNHQNFIHGSGHSSRESAPRAEKRNYNGIAIIAKICVILLLFVASSNSQTPKPNTTALAGNTTSLAGNTTTPASSALINKISLFSVVVAVMTPVLHSGC